MNPAFPSPLESIFGFNLSIKLGLPLAVLEVPVDPAPESIPDPLLPRPEPVVPERDDALLSKFLSFSVKEVVPFAP